jgi:uncharacterized RDD family membrane protein YckC
MEHTVIPSIFEQMETEQPFFIYATPGQRLANLLIDSIICYGLYVAVLFLIAVLMAVTGSAQNEIEVFASNRVLLLLLSMTTNITYFILFEKFTKGRTIGKLITRTQAVKTDLSPISWKETFIRTLSRLVPFDAFSAIGNHPWHDRWSNTIVIKKQRRVI